MGQSNTKNNQVKQTNTGNNLTLTNNKLKIKKFKSLQTLKTVTDSINKTNKNTKNLSKIKIPTDSELEEINYSSILSHFSQYEIKRFETLETAGINVFTMLNPFLLFGIIKGHGGHKVQAVSSFKRIFNQKIKSEDYLKPLLSLEDIGTAKELFNKLFRDVQEDIQFINTYKNLFLFTGVTCNFVMLNKGHVFCINLGCNKAIIAHENEELKKTVIELSIDQNLSRKGEVDRIKSRAEFHYVENKTIDDIYPFSDLEDSDVNSRAFGVNDVRGSGITEVPEVTELKINENYKFIFIGTKNIFNLINSLELFKMINDEFEYRDKRSEIGKKIQDEYIKRSEFVNDYKRYEKEKIKENGKNINNRKKVKIEKKKLENLEEACGIVIYLD